MSERIKTKEQYLIEEMAQETPYRDPARAEIFVSCQLETKEKRVGKGKTGGNSDEKIFVFDFVQQQQFLFFQLNLLRLTASSYDIIDGFELLPPIVHFLTLF